MTLSLRACWIIAVVLNAINLVMTVYARLDAYLHPVGDVILDDWLTVFLLSVPAMSLVVLLWLAKRFPKPHDLERA
jgi:hypothetical protein